MTQAKIYDVASGLWKPIIAGPAGPPGIFTSPTAPSDTSVLWLDTSSTASTVALQDLSNTTITSVANNDLLKYNSATSRWINSNTISVTDATLAGTTSLTGTTTATGLITANGGIGTTAITASTTLGVTGLTTATGGVTTGAASTVNLGAGTNTVPPLDFATGTNGTTATGAVAGAIEFDGVAFYKTLVATSGRALSQSSYAYYQNAARVVTTPAAAATGIFGAGTTTAGVGLTLSAGSYEFEMFFQESQTETATSHVLQLLFPCTSGTYASINYVSVTSSVTSTSAATAITTSGTISTALTITGAATTAASVTRSIFVRGFFRLSVGGTWTPQMQWSTASGVSGNLTIAAGSHVKVTPVNSNTATNTAIGAWA